MAYNLQEQRTVDLERSGIETPGGTPGRTLEDELHDVIPEPRYPKSGSRVGRREGSCPGDDFPVHSPES